MPSLATMQTITLAGVVVGLAMLGYMLRRGLIDWRLALAPGAWLVHGLVFLLAWFLVSPGHPSEIFTAWSLALRFQAILTLLGAFVFYAWDNRYGS